MLRAFLIAFSATFAAGIASAADLLTSIQAGSVEVISVNGTGGSSGASLNGVLRNTTASELQLDTVLPNPVFFDNGSDGQNMVATQLYLGDMGYFMEGGRSFITLAPGQTVPVVFIAYCADFDLPNPEASHQFAVAALPADLDQIARKISAYEANAVGTDLTVPAQVALWMARGETPEEIRKKFEFTDQDLAVASDMLD